jgi:hypothetical protein
MTVDFSQWPGADDVLDAALALPPEQRVSYVRGTVSNPELLRALEAVLAEAGSSDLDPSQPLLRAREFGRDLFTRHATDYTIDAPRGGRVWEP